MKRIMIDVETLGLSVDSPIFEIGVVTFSQEDGIIETLHLHLDLMDVMFETGFVAEKGTLEWWRKQAYKPNGKRNRLPLKRSLKALTDFMESHKPHEVWANSPAFDLILLKEHYKAIGEKEPWEYRQERDYRTIRRLAEELGLPIQKHDAEEPSHNARDDALGQSHSLLKTLVNIKSLTSRWSE